MEISRKRLKADNVELSLVTAIVADEKEGNKLNEWFRYLSPTGTEYAGVIGNVAIRVVSVDTEKDKILMYANEAGFDIKPEDIGEEQVVSRPDVIRDLGQTVLEAITNQPATEAELVQSQQAVEPSPVLVGLAA